MALFSATTRSVQRRLEKHVELVHLRRLAFVVALVSCLSAGSIMLFSLYAALLHENGLSYTQINLIVLVSAVGMYLFLPAVGYLADCHGPPLLLIISVFTFCPAYALNAFIVRRAPRNGWVFLAASFGFIGLATSCLYFASLLTCARIYPQHRSLAISLPVSCYGLLSLMGLQLMKAAYFHNGGQLDLFRVFGFFAVLYLVVGLLNFVLNCVVSTEKEAVFEVEPLYETEPLLNPDGPPTSPRLEPVRHRERYVAFLKDRSAWVLLVLMFLAFGPLESFQNNLGLILEAFGGARLADQVLVLALSSTLIRLLIGVVADWMLSPKRLAPVCKVWVLLALALVGAVGQFLVPTVPLSVSSVLAGVSYGGLFTVCPTIVASVWGVDLMGSTWGSFMVSPALGSIFFSLLHGHYMDLCGGKCLKRYFVFTLGSMAASAAVAAYVWRRHWVPRGLRCF